jgi:hypothetical protein
MKSNRQASALLLVLFVVAITATLIGAALSWSTSSSLVSQRATQLAVGYSALDGAQELMFARWRDIMRCNPTQDFSAQDLINGVTIPIAGVGAKKVSVTAALGANVEQPDFAKMNVNVTDLKMTLTHVTQFGSPRPTTEDPQLDVNPNWYKGSTPGFPGYVSYNIVYEATVTGKIQYRGEAVNIGVKRYFTKVKTPVFQNAVFFQDDLELHNSGQTIIDGQVHTNSDMYACSFRPGSLDFQGNVSHVGKFNGAESGADGTVMMSDSAQSRFAGNATDAPLWNGGKAPGQQLRKVDSMNVGGIDQSEFDQSDDNRNNDSLREVIEIPYKNDPTKSLNDPANKLDATLADPPDIQQQRAYTQAPLRVIINKAADGTYKITARDSNDDPITNTGFLNDLNAAIPSTLRGRVLHDRREDPGAGDPDAGNDTAVRVTTLDLELFDKAIKNGINSGAIKYAKTTDDPTSTTARGWNGMLYIADITGNDGVGQAAAGPAMKRGIMLVNGGRLPGFDLSAGDATHPADINRRFTVATQNGLYIKGDYNTGSRYIPDPNDNSKKIYVDQPLSNTDNTNPKVKTVADGYENVPSAVMADAVTVVSRNFVDANNSDPEHPISEGNLMESIQYEENNPVRKAVATTINTAVVSGDVVSNYNSTGKPSGGAHNLTRFLENWDDPTIPGGQNKVKFTYNGSLVQLFQSQEFTGAWDTRNIYQNPQRLIRFDRGFLDKSPVGSPNTIKYYRGKWTRFQVK